MARYIMDCFYPDSSEPDGYRSQSFAMMANSQINAIEEANWTAIWRTPAWFTLRIVKSGRETIVFRSEQGKHIVQDAKAATATLFAR